MSVTMKLDAPAVRKLIADDEAFTLELQSAVLQEIVRGMFDKSIPATMRDVIDSAFKDHQETLKEVIASDVEFRAQLDSALSGLVQSIRNSTVGYGMQRVLDEEAKRMIDQHVNQKITEAVDRHKETLSDKVDALILRLEQRFEKEIEANLSRMDENYHQIAYQEIMKKFVAFSTK